MLTKTKENIKNGQSRDPILYWTEDTERRPTKHITEPA